MALNTLHIPINHILLSYYALSGSPGEISLGISQFLTWWKMLRNIDVIIALVLALSNRPERQGRDCRRRIRMTAEAG